MYVLNEIVEHNFRNYSFTIQSRSLLKKLKIKIRLKTRFY